MNSYYAECPNMIPAERCEVIIHPSMLARSQAKDVGIEALVMDLEAMGVDEIKCSWAGPIDMTDGDDAHGRYVEADCPLCGQPIRLYDALVGRAVVLGSEPGPVARDLVSEANRLTDPAHRYLLHVVVDDDWQPIVVRCDLPTRTEGAW